MKLTTRIIVYITILSYIVTSCTNSKDLFSTPTQKIIVTQKDTTSIIHITTKQNTSNNIDKTYFYYNLNSINSSKGYYVGNLLHGSFYSLNHNGTLLKKGSYKKGLKNKTWIEWYPNGNIKTIEKWKNGRIRRKKYCYSFDGIEKQTFIKKKGTWQEKEIFQDSFNNKLKKFISKISFKRKKNINSNKQHENIDEKN